MAQLAELVELAELLAAEAERSSDQSVFPVRLLVVQPTPFCNIDCDYCYLPHRRSKDRLSMATLARVFENLSSSGLVSSELTVVWHAGEPLVLPVDFYTRALAMIRGSAPRDCVISHSIQTNGMLVDDAWCAFFTKNSIGVGISLDGPAFLHDAHRKTRTGRGTHTDVMRGVGALQRNAVPFHVICVLTRDSLGYPDEIVDFFVRAGVRHVGFNVEELEGVHRTTSITPEVLDEYRAFMRRVYDLVTADRQGGLRVREFDRAHAVIEHGLHTRMVGGGQLPLNEQVTPFSILTIGAKGTVSTFSPELFDVETEHYGTFALGDVWTSSVAAILQHDEFKRIRRDIDAGVEMCRATCEYFFLCGGGAPANKYFEHGTFRATETTYCRCIVQTPVDIVLEDLEQSLPTLPP